MRFEKTVQRVGGGYSETFSGFVLDAVWLQRALQK